MGHLQATKLADESMFASQVAKADENGRHHFLKLAGCLKHI